MTTPSASRSPRSLAAAALRGDGPRGVRWLPAVTATSWGAAADEAGWSVRRLDTAGTLDKQGFMAACVSAFSLPEWFGRNWDALEECLRDLAPGGSRSDGQPPPRGIVVVWSGWEPFRRSDPEAFRTAVDVLDDVGAAWLVALVGSGSDPGVPRWPA